MRLTKKKSVTKRKSQKQERSVANTFNARLTPASGALWGAKGDVRNDKFLIECKTTEKSSYTLTAKVWEKIHEEAVRDHLRIPLLIVDLEDSERYVVFRPIDFGQKKYEDNEVKKSFKIYKGIVGETDFGDYIYAVYFTTGFRQINRLCVMLYKDFEDKFKEDIKLWH